MGNKGWSILFGVVMTGCAVGFGISPIMGWWMPEGISEHAHEVDNLFNIILGIVAFFFILTEGLLVAFLWYYASGPDGKRPIHSKAEMPGYIKPLGGFLTNQHRVEMAWTFVPAVILLFIAFAQVDAWARIKYISRKDAQAGETASLQVGISARQFEWRIRYPGSKRFDKWMKDKAGTKADFDSFGKIPQPDDVQTVNELHIWQDHQVVVHLTTRDVIHSFNLPNFRVKQDALPGKMIPVWFKTKKELVCFNCQFDQSKQRWVDGIDPKTGKEDTEVPNRYHYDIPCAELCGWGHYRMIGRVYVHKDQADFMDWLKMTEENNHAHQRIERAGKVN